MLRCRAALAARDDDRERSPLNAEGRNPPDEPDESDAERRSPARYQALVDASEKALRESESRYRTLFASIDDGFCIVEKIRVEPGGQPDFCFVECNRAFESQYDLSEVVGKSVRQAFPGESDEWIRKFDSILESGERVQFESPLLPQGRTLELNAFRVEDGGNRRVALAVKDVSERRQSDIAKARLAAIVESSDDAIVGKGLNGIINSWNLGAERIFGYTAEEVIGKPVTILIPEDRLDEEQSILARIRRSEVVDHFETVRRRKDGSLLNVSVTVSPIRDSSGTVVGASKIARDITERKRADEALREADRHKTVFLAMLAHELRNPLAPILVSIEVLRQTRSLGESSATSFDSSSDVDSALDVLQRQVGQMVRLVDDLLDAGRISTGKIELRRERVLLSPVVAQAVEAARPLFERMHHALTVSLPPDPVHLDADPARLAQIIGNLLSNAGKFTPDGGKISLTVELETRARVPQRVAIRVRDTGIGIGSDQLGRVFELFAQADTSLERSVSGLGIGLTLVRTLTELHGGTIEVYSAGAGQGSEFVVRLPVAEKMDALEAAGPRTSTTPVTPMRILVVDDNRDAAEMLALLLKLSGHETHTAYDGVAAVETAASLDPDVILLDIGLPLLNGYEVARRIRERQDGAGRPLLVALTGWGQDEDRRRSADSGFDAHVVKPMDEAVLTRLLAEFAARKRDVEP